MTLGGEHGPADRLGRRPPNSSSASAAFTPPSQPPPMPFPVAATGVALDPQRDVRADPRLGLFRGHLEHRAVRRRDRAVLRGERLQRRRATSASTRCSSSRRSTSSSPSPRRCRSRCSASALFRPHPRRARGSDAVAPRGRGLDLAPVLRHRRPDSRHLGRGRRHRAAADRALPILAAEFAKRENWMALTPSEPDSRPCPCARSMRAPSWSCIRSACCAISQRAVPLELAIDKVGNQTVADIDARPLKVTASGAARRRRRCVSPSRRRSSGTSTTAAKLSAPGYEPQVAGHRPVGRRATRSPRSHAVKRIVLHELIIIDSNYKEHLEPVLQRRRSCCSLHLLGSNAAARSRCPRGHPARPSCRSTRRSWRPRPASSWPTPARTTPSSPGISVFTSQGGGAGLR